MTGVDGSFRQGCEHILRVARKHSATLGSLLGSILRDPLVTWALDRQQAGSKKVSCYMAVLVCVCVLPAETSRNLAFYISFCGCFVASHIIHDKLQFPYIAPTPF